MIGLALENCFHFNFCNIYDDSQVRHRGVFGGFRCLRLLPRNHILSHRAGIVNNSFQLCMLKPRYVYNILASVDTIGNLSEQRSLWCAGRQPVSSTDFGGKPANSAAWAARDTAPRGPGPPFLARRRATARAAKTRVVAGVGMMRARWSLNVDGNGCYNGRRIVHGLPALLTFMPATAAVSALLSCPYPCSFSYCQPFF